MPAGAPLFDVDRFRAEPERVAVVREVARPTLVLGSTQPEGVVAAAMTRRADRVAVARRRGGGGAVYLEPGAQLWVDAWIPHSDPLWDPDVAAAAAWVGAWWVSALSPDGRGRGLEIHTGRAVPGALGGLVCFAGRGPGEVFAEGRKVVGLSQWRAREGALFSSSAYLRWDPVPLLAALEIDDAARSDLANRLERVAIGLTELDDPVGDLATVRHRLLGSFTGLARPQVHPATRG